MAKLVVLVKFEFDSLATASDGSSSLIAVLEELVHKAKYTVAKINDVEFTDKLPFSECVWCDGCDDDDNITDYERNAHIIPELLALKEEA